MNVKQLELKRLGQIRDAIRFARHMTQAERKPLAQLLRFEHAANVRLRKAIGAYERATDQTYNDELSEGVHLELWQAREALTANAKLLAQQEQQLSKRIDRLKKDKRLTFSALELRNVRKRLERARKTKKDKKLQGLLMLAERARTFAPAMKSARTANAVAFMIEDAERGGELKSTWTWGIAALREAGETEAANALAEVYETFQRDFA